ncbi:MAG: WD40 repeat domain-containing protein, partial [Chitinophagaceae bacterium]|nr:WD40 repeat domain-containing protein [Chitinophagaceae bacterium]
MLIRYLILLLSILFLIDPIGAQKVRVVSPVSHNWKGSKAVFTSDGTKIVTGDNEGVIKFWDVETGKLLHTVYHSAEILKNLKLSPNDKWLSGLSDNGEIHIWSMKTGKLHMHIPGEVHWANDVSFSQDSKLIASISYDTAAIWNVETGELLKKWNIGKGGDKILFTPNPNLVFIETFSIEERNNFQIWDYKSAKKIAFPSTNFWATIKGNTMLDWKGDTLVSYNLENGKMTAQWKTGGQKIEKATFCGDNVALYVTSDAVLHKTDLKTGKEIFSLPCKLEKDHNGFFISITVNLQGTYAIVTDHEGNGQIIDVTSGKLLTELPKLNNYNNYYDPCFNNEGNMLAIPGPIDEAVSIWNLPDSNRRMIGKKISLPSTKAVLLKNNYLLSLNDNEFTCFNINTNQPQWTLPIRSNKHDFDNFTPEEKFLFLWNDSGRIAIYSLPDGVIVKEILNTPLKKAALSKDGELVLMINEKEIKIIRVKDDKIIFSKPINKYYEDEALFSNDGQYLMWMNAAGWYKKFDLQAGGKADSSFIGKDRFLNYIKQSPDGSKVVVNWRSRGEAFSNVSVLDYATGKILWELPQEYAWIETIRFSNDGNYVIITTIKGGDAEVRDAGNGKVLGNAEISNQTIDAGFLKNGQLFYIKENT